MIDQIEEPLKTEPLKRKRSTPENNPHYVSNKEFTAAISEWIISNKNAGNRKHWSVMPQYVAECFVKIIDHYALKGNWRGYSYIDEMKSEAILNCIKYAHNFDVTRGNAFAYFTQYVHNSFLQILASEKKQANIKFKAISEDSEYNYNLINLHDENEDE